MPVPACLRLAALAALLVTTPPARAGAAEGDPFEVRTLRVSGRPIEIFPLAAEGGRRGLGVIVVREAPPNEVREVALFEPAPDVAALAPRSVAIAPDVVAIDVADVDPAPGDELVLVSARRIDIIPTSRGASPRSVALLPPLPLPPRTHGLSLLGATADWAGEGEPAVVVPDAEGARLVALRTGEATELASAPWADYESLEPAPGRGMAFFAQLSWPSFTAGRDTAEGGHDLFALSRYRVDVFRAAGSRFSSRPSRSIRLQPFSADEEMRRRATQIRILARDLDGDGLTDLLLHRSFGTLLRSEHRLEIHRNAGTGADPSSPPDARLAPEAGLAVVDAVDLDGDGRCEIVQARIEFGIVQMLRVLTTRRAQVELRVDRIEGPGITGLARAWTEPISVGLDFAQGRLEGLFPTVEGDWNGDGRRDLLLGLSSSEIEILLGTRGESGPGFSAAAVRQRVPASGRALVADLDGDGLDDLVVHDPNDATGTVDWLRNTGALPGVSPALRATPRPEP